jgi:predicted phage terminase large subunit-like protein
MGLPTLRDVTAEFCRRDFYRFVREAWPYVMPGVEFVPGWHIEGICKYLQSLDDSKFWSIIKKIFMPWDVRTLILNIPPGHMKSLLVNVFFPAWVWTRDQRKRFICITHSEVFATRDSLLCRNLVSSEWYTSHFHFQLAEGDQLKTRYSNTNGGFRHAYGLSGMTGDHGDYLLLDDLLSIEDRYSDAEIKTVNDLYDNILPTRLDPRYGKKVLIMQRLGQNDLAGHIRRIGEPAEFLVLPVEYEGEVFKSSIGFKDPRKKKGELLWPQMFDGAWLTRSKATMSDMDVAGQFQQRPSPISGNFWKRDWFKTRMQNTSIIARFISWDTAASIEDTAAYSACVVGEIMDDYRMFIRYVRRGRWIFPELQRNIEEIAVMYKFALKNICVESKSSGQSVMQSLNAGSAIIHRLENELNIDPGQLLKPVNPMNDKNARCQLISNFLEKGMVILPQPDSTNAEWLNLFEEEIFEVPNSAYRDQSDAFSQLVWFVSNYLETALTGRGVIQ